MIIGFPKFVNVIAYMNTKTETFVSCSFLIAFGGSYIKIEA